MQVFFSVRDCATSAERTPRAAVRQADGDGTPRLSRPLNLLLEPRAPQRCGFCGRVDFITFLSRRPSPPPPRRGPPRRATVPFIVLLLTPGLCTHSPPRPICRDGNDNSLLDFLVGGLLHGTSPGPVPERAVNGRYETKRRRKRREDDGGRHALATGRNLPRSGSWLPRAKLGSCSGARAPFS